MMDRPFIDVLPEEPAPSAPRSGKRLIAPPTPFEDLEDASPFGIGPDVAAAVASRHGVTAEQMLGRAQSAALSAARSELYVTLYTQRWSYPEIARFVQRHQSQVRNVVMAHRAREAQP